VCQAVSGGTIVTRRWGYALTNIIESDNTSCDNLAPVIETVNSKL